MGDMRRSKIAEGAEIVRSAGGSTTVDHFVASYRSRYSASTTRADAVDVLRRIINAGHLVLDDGVVSLPAETTD